MAAGTLTKREGERRGSFDEFRSDFSVCWATLSSAAWLGSLLLLESPYTMIPLRRLQLTAIHRTPCLSGFFPGEDRGAPQTNPVQALQETDT